jgi:hypothetical protein
MLEVMKRHLAQAGYPLNCVIGPGLGISVWIGDPMPTGQAVALRQGVCSELGNDRRSAAVVLDGEAFWQWKDEVVSRGPAWSATPIQAEPIEESAFAFFRRQQLAADSMEDEAWQKQLKRQMKALRSMARLPSAGPSPASGWRDRDHRVRLALFDCESALVPFYFGVGGWST